MTDSTPARSPLVGIWRLLSFEVRSADEEVTRPFGDDPRGLLIYTPEGRYSYQLNRADRPHFAAGDQMKGTEDEILLNYRGFVSYYGRYRIDPTDSSVIHAVEGSLFPNWEGREQLRFYRLVAGRLELTTPDTQWGGGEEIVAATLWERADA